MSAVLAGDAQALLAAGAKQLPMDGIMSQVSKATSSLGVDRDTLMALASGDPAALVEIATKKFRVSASATSDVCADGRRQLWVKVQDPVPTVWFVCLACVSRGCSAAGPSAGAGVAGVCSTRPR